MTDALLSAAQHHLGDTGDDPRYGSRGAKYTLWPQPSAEDLRVRSFSQSSELAGMVSALNGHPHLRWYADSFIVKLGAPRAAWRRRGTRTSRSTRSTVPG